MHLRGPRRGNLWLAVGLDPPPRSGLPALRPHAAQRRPAPARRPLPPRRTQRWSRHGLRPPGFREPQRGVCASKAFLRTSGLRHDGADLSLVFLDSSHNKLESVASARISDAIAWRKLCVGPVSPPVGAASVLVGLHVKPQGDVQDLHGTAAFGGLWLGQVPRILLTAQPAADTPSDQPRPARHRSDAKSPPTCSLSDAKFLLFSRGRPIEIACVVSGFPAPSYEIRLRLLDVDGRVVARRETQMTSALARTTWRIPGNAVGFYRVRAAVVPAAGSPSARLQESRQALAHCSAQIRPLDRKALPAEKCARPPAVFQRPGLHRKPSWVS